MKLDAEWLEWLGGYVREKSGLKKKTIIDWLRSKNTLIKSRLASKITWANAINHEGSKFRPLQQTVHHTFL